MSVEDVTDVSLVAAALQGESTYWFAMPRNGRPLPDDWSSANCFWLYPVERDLARFASVPGFNPTDAVYELDPSGMSPVYPSAALKSNVEAKKYRKDRATYFFIPAEEVDWVEREYKAMLKREADSRHAGQELANETRRVAVKKQEPSAVKKEEGIEAQEEKIVDLRADPAGGAAEAVIAAASEHNRGSSAPPQQEESEGDDQEEEEEEEKEKARQGRQRQRGGRQERAPQLYDGSHKRRAPHRGTTVYIAPIHQNGIGSYKSSEAFTWPAHYIVHRGSADFLCPAATGNRYGFRLDKVTHNGFPVFLLFGSGVNNSEEVDINAHGVPAMETAVLHGEGGDRGMGNTVMIITRPPSAKHGHCRDSGGAAGGATAAATTTSGGGGRKRRRLGFAPDDEDDSEEDEHERGEDLWPTSSSEDDDANDEDYDESNSSRGGGRRRRGGGGGGALAGRTARDTVASSKAARADRSSSSATSRKAKKVKPALQTASVNIWTDPERAVPEVKQLAQQYPFAYDTSAPLRTTVFENGTCVTYSAAIAEKAQKSAEAKSSGNSSSAAGKANNAKHSGGSNSVNRLGGNAPDDDAIRSLLENVQLAQLQNQSANDAAS